MLKRHFIPGSVALALLVAAGTSRAQQSAGGEVSFSSSDATVSSPAGDDSGAFLAAGKIGGIAQFDGLYPYLHGGLDLGYVFPGTGRTIGAYLGTEYTAPRSDGTGTDPGDPERVAGGTYEWKLRQKQLVFQPTFLYRFNWLTDAVVPFVGIGPRLYLLESKVTGSAGGRTIKATEERSTKFGFGIPVGAEVPLGPGGLMAELLFQWAPLDHETTGDTHLAGLSLFLGYRALL
jgi:hypothetical protein